MGIILYVFDNLFLRQTVCLGSGQFGTVFKGVWKQSYNISKVEVAIKILRNNVGEKEKLKFLQEGAIIGQFQHPNVVKLHGMVTVGEPVSSSCMAEMLLLTVGRGFFQGFWKQIMLKLYSIEFVP